MAAGCRARRAAAGRPATASRVTCYDGDDRAARQEVRVTGIGDRLVQQRRDAWASALVRCRRFAGDPPRGTRSRGPSSAARGAVVFVALDSGRRPAACCWSRAGSRLSAYIGATVGELGFLTGFWAYGARRLAWLEDYAASLVALADLPVPARLERGIRFEHVSFAYPGTERLVLDDVNLELPAGAVVAIVGENGAGKSTLVKLLAKLYDPGSGRILVDGADLARMPADEWRGVWRCVPGFLPLRVQGAAYRRSW